MVHYLYHHDYLEERVIRINNVMWREALLDEHSRMYAMGEKYGIPGLKSVALTKFMGQFPKVMVRDCLVPTTVIAFNSTPESDKDLRKAVIEMLHGSHRVWKGEAAVHKMILGMPEVAYALYLKSTERDLL